LKPSIATRTDIHFRFRHTDRSDLDGIEPPFHGSIDSICDDGSLAFSFHLVSDPDYTTKMKIKSEFVKDFLVKVSAKAIEKRKK
jgi:hypothetical protein